MDVSESSGYYPQIAMHIFSEHVQINHWILNDFEVAYFQTNPVSNHSYR